ncbi:hypothetical protein C8F01DRAFT_1160532 [Mycena amicta]|nr:hypothetical protein C8F01DRAFT_1160532 [Mycena amicta]
MATPLRLRHHLTPSKSTLTCYLGLAMVQYLVPDRDLDYSLPYARPAYALITPFMYLACGHVAGRAIVLAITALLSLWGGSKKTETTVPDDEESSIALDDSETTSPTPTPAEPRGARAFLKSLLPTLIIFLLTVPAAALLHLSQNPASAASSALLIAGTVDTLRRVELNFLFYASVGLFALVLMLLAPIYIMRYQVKLVGVLGYTTVACNVLLLYSAALTRVEGFHSEAQYLQTIQAHLRWQAASILSPTSCWFGILVFFVQTLYLFTSQIARRLYRRALAAEPTLFRMKDGYTPPSYFALAFSFFWSVVIPALVVLAGILLQDRGDKLLRWGKVLAILTLFSLGIVALDFGIYFLLVQKKRPFGGKHNTLDEMGVIAGVYMLKNKDGESFWTMLEQIKAAQEKAEQEKEKEKDGDPEKAQFEVEDADAAQPPLITLTTDDESKAVALV